MQEVTLKKPWVEAIAVTRAALGAGAGLLLASRVRGSRRQVIGWSLLAAGLISTVPLMIKVYGSQKSASPRRTR